MEKTPIISSRFVPSATCRTRNVSFMHHSLLLFIQFTNTRNIYRRREPQHVQRGCHVKTADSLAISHVCCLFKQQTTIVIVIIITITYNNNITIILLLLLLFMLTISSVLYACAGKVNNFNQGPLTVIHQLYYSQNHGER